MNEQIQKLISEAVKAIPDHVDFDLPKEFTEKFAELIVKECVGIVAKRKDQAIEDSWKVDEAMSAASFDIEDHFGIIE
jgi:hypothetical protein